MLLELESMRPHSDQLQSVTIIQWAYDKFSIFHSTDFSAGRSLVGTSSKVAFHSSKVKQWFLFILYFRLLCR